MAKSVMVSSESIGQRMERMELKGLN